MERLEQKIRAYFAACDATRERIPLKNGGVEERQTPYTLYGLAVAMGYAPKRILALADGEGKTARLFREAVSRIAAYTLEHALLGELSHQMALAVLSMLTGDDSRAETSGTLEITMDEAAQRWSR